MCRKTNKIQTFGTQACKKSRQGQMAEGIQSYWVRRARTHVEPDLSRDSRIRATRGRRASAGVSAAKGKTRKMCAHY